MVTNNVPSAKYTEELAAAFQSTDMSNQGDSGTTDTMVNSIESMKNFGAGK